MMDLLAELVLPPLSMCFDLSAQRVTFVQRNIIEGLLYGETNPQI
jgi:hypothetical protein